MFSICVIKIKRLKLFPKFDFICLNLMNLDNLIVSMSISMNFMDFFDMHHAITIQSI